MKKSHPILTFLDPGFLSFLQVIFWITFLFFRLCFLALRLLFFSLLPAILHLAKSKDANAVTLARGYRWGSSSFEQLFPRPITARGYSGHQLVFGLPGVGKTNFALDAMVADLQHHRSFAFIDPHSDAFRQVVKATIHAGYDPSHVLILDPDPQARSFGYPGINLLEGEERFESVSEVLAVMRELWPDAFGPRSESIMRSCMLALAETGLTLGEAELFLTNAAFRSAVLQAIADPEVKHFWTNHFDSLRESEQHVWTEAPRNKLSNLLGSEYVRALFSQSSTVNLAEFLNQPGRVILINASPHLHDSQRMFAALCLAKIWDAIYSRERLLPQERIPVSIYADEAAGYLTTSCLRLLAESRKFACALKLFAQSPLQYEPHADILFGTTGAVISFTVDYRAGEMLCKQLFLFHGDRFPKQGESDFLFGLGTKSKPSQFLSIHEEHQRALNALMTMPKGTCVIRLRGEDDPDPWVAIIPLVTVPPLDPGREEAWRRENAAVFCRSFPDIAQERQQRLARFLSPPPINITNRS